MAAKPVITVAPGVRAMQLKELQRRLQAVGYQVRTAAEHKAVKPEPLSIKQARAAVKKFDDANYQRERKANKAAQVRVDEARNTILFGDVGKALKLVEKLEAEARNVG